MFDVRITTICSYSLVLVAQNIAAGSWKNKGIIFYSGIGTESVIKNGMPLMSSSAAASQKFYHSHLFRILLHLVLGRDAQ